METQSWDWVFHTLGWTLAGLGLLLTLWALFWDRSRGRTRCPKCWYSMEGAVEGEGGGYVCPECGKGVSNARSLHRTRRRPRWVVAACIVWLCSYGVFVTPAVRRDGWVGVTPTSALIVIASPERMRQITIPWSRSAKTAIGHGIEDELTRRGEQRSIYDWQADFLAWRIRRADNDAAGTTEFRSYDITDALSPAWWHSPFRFTSDDRAELAWTIRDLLVSHVVPELWIENGGEDASLCRFGNRFFVWAPRTEQHAIEMTLALFVTKGKGDVVSVPSPRSYDDASLTHEIRMYDVTDIAPPNVERYELPIPLPEGDHHWSSPGELVLIEDDEAFALIDDITANVKMELWIDNGGELAKIRSVHGWLVVWAEPEMHKLVAERIASYRKSMMGGKAGPP